MNRFAPIEEQEHAQANYFAMCLLLPEHLVRREVARFERLDIMSPAFTTLAKKFQVSESLLTLRLVQLGIVVP